MRVTALLLTFLLAACEADPPEQTAHRRAWTIMGTTLEMTVYRPQGDDAAADFEAAYAEIETVDQLMSLYRSDSELTILNTSRGGAAFAVSPYTLDVIQASQHFSEVSAGAFDVSVKPLIDLWGFYDVATASLPDETDIAKALMVTGVDQVALSDTSVRLTEGAALDFGAIAKGYAVDLAIAALQTRGVRSAMVNLGGTIGVTGPHPDGSPWRIGLQHPRQAALMATVELSTGAVATSGDYDRFFEVDGRRYSHIVDPRTGWPVSGMASVSVVAPNATTADAVSTAAFVLGADDGIDLLNACNAITGLSAAIASDGGIDVAYTEAAGVLTVAVEDAANLPDPNRGVQCVWPPG